MWKQGAQPLRVDWPVYPRRADHTTIAEGGNRRWAETARQNAAPIALAEADQVAQGKVIHVRFSFNLPICWGLVWRKP